MSEQKKSQQIIVKRVSASDKQILGCKGGIWSGMKGQVIETAATPLANQPSPYIKATFDEKKIGAVKEISIKAVHNGKSIFFHLNWKSKSPNYEIGDVGTFPDAAAVLLPFKDPEKTQIKEMGSKDFPTNSWYWRPDFEKKPKNQPKVKQVEVPQGDVDEMEYLYVYYQNLTYKDYKVEKTDDSIIIKVK